MTTFTTTAPSTVDIRVQGLETTIDIAAIPTDMLHVMIAYGVRRRYQDTINNVAKQLREAGEPVDGAALFTDFHKRVMESDLGSRGEAVGSDPLDKFRKAIVREALAKDKKSEGWLAYEAIDSADRKARDSFLLDIAKRNASKVDPKAKQRLEAERNKVSDLDIDF